MATRQERLGVRDEATTSQFDAQILLRELAQGLLWSRTEDQILEVTSRILRQLWPDYAALAMVTPDGQALEIATVSLDRSNVRRLEELVGRFIPGATYLGHRIPIHEDGNIYGRMIRERKPLVWNTDLDEQVEVVEATGDQIYADYFSKDGPVRKVVPLLRRLIPFASSISIPLMDQGRAVGDVAIGSQSRLGQEDFNLLSTFASIISGALERVRLERLLERQNRELRRIQDVAEEVARERDIEKVLQRIVKEVAEACGTEMNSILFADMGRGVLVHGVAVGLPEEYVAAISTVPIGGPGGGCCGTAAARGDIVIVEDMRTDPLWRPYRELSERAGLRAVWSVPIMSREGGVLGTFATYYDHPVRPSPELVATVKTYARAAALAIENNRVVADLERRSSQLSVVNAVARRASASLELDEVLQGIAEEVLVQLGFSNVGILLVDPDSRELVMKGQSGERFEEISPGYRQSVAEGVVGEVARSGQTLLVEEVVGDPRYKEVIASTRSELCVPITIEGEVVGCFNVESDRPGAFDAQDAETLEAMAQEVALAVRNARSFELVAKRADQLRLVSELGRKASQMLDPTRLMELVAELTYQTFRYYAVSLWMLDEGEREVVFRAGAGEYIGDLPWGARIGLDARGIMPWVAQHGEPLLVNDVTEDPRYREFEGLPRTRSELAVPIKRDGQIVGVLDVQGDRPGVFDLADQATLETLAGHVASALSNAELFRRLDQSESRYRTLVEGANEGIILLDREERILFNNRQFAEMLGYTPGELIGQITFEHLAPGEDERLREEMKIRVQGEPSTYELAFRHRDGHPVHTLVSGSPLMEDGKYKGSFGFLTDITKRKQLEQEVLAQKRHLEATLASTSDGILVITYGEQAGDEVITLANRAFGKIFGVDPGGIIGRPEIEVRGGVARCFKDPDGFNRLADALLRKREVYSFDTLELVEPRPIVIEMVTGPVRDARGSIIGRIVSLRDVTGRIEAEEEKARLREQLYHSEKLAALGQLVSGVAHELNNPLTGVQGYAELLSRQELPEGVKRDIGRIRGEAERAAVIVRNLLTFARRQSPRRAAVQINEMIGKAVELRTYELQVNDIEVQLELDLNLPLAFADGHQLQQVFLNLIVNAEQALLGAGRGGWITIRTERAGDRVRAAVMDDGPGIPEDVLPRIFEPFFTTKEVGEGTGLGLSVCYGILEDHGGSLSVESPPGEGATFIVELPVATEEQSSGVKE